ncbi:MAG: hypothetical protein ACN6O7_02460 [Sphingobacterium sp.]
MFITFPKMLYEILEKGIAKSSNDNDYFPEGSSSIIALANANLYVAEFFPNSMIARHCDSRLGSFIWNIVDIYSNSLTALIN